MFISDSKDTEDNSDKNLKIKVKFLADVVIYL